jgi:hypothetical protein
MKPSVQALVEQNDSIKKLVANGPEVRSNDFLASVRDKLLKYGSLSERQIAAVTRTYEYSENRQAATARREAERAELVATGVKAPEGKALVIGEIVAVKSAKYGWGLTVKTVDGWAAWLRMPNGLAGDDSPASLRGKKIKFEATLTRSDRDDLFAFAKKPSNAVITA